MSLKKVGVISALVLSHLTHEGEGMEHAPEEPKTDNQSVSKAIADRPSAVSFYTLFLRTGPAPTNKTDRDSGTLLAEAGVYSEGRVAPAPIINSGTAGHFRIKTSTGKTVYQGRVTTTEGEGDLTFDNTICVAGGTLAVGFSSGEPR